MSSFSFFHSVFAVRVLRALSERNTFATVLGDVYLKSELKHYYTKVYNHLYLCVYFWSKTES